MSLNAPAVEAALDRFKGQYTETIELSLGRIEQLLDAKDNPHLKLPPVIHVAGTNGKGSTTAFMRAMAEAAGLKTHVFTSPHLVRFNERIRLAGDLISDEYLLDVLERTYQALGDGEYQLIYATPERMGKPEFVEALERVPGGVKLLAVDEAHCITKWGHDLRPAYQEGDVTVAVILERIEPGGEVAAGFLAAMLVHGDDHGIVRHSRQKRFGLLVAVFPCLQFDDRDIGDAEIAALRGGAGQVLIRQGALVLVAHAPYGANGDAH